MEVGVKVGKLVRQDIRVREDVEGLLAEAFLHFYHVFAQAVLTGQLVRHGEVIYLLVLCHLLVNGGLYTLRRP